MKLFTSLFTLPPPIEEGPIMITRTEAKIAACIFMKFDPTNGAWIIGSEKHYFYLDPHDLRNGSLALVHNGKEFGVVKVMQHTDYANDTVAAKVTKPLICEVTSNSARYAHAINDISLKQEELTTKRIQANIQRELNHPRVSRDFSDEGY